MLVGKDARTLARDELAMTHEELSAAFQKSAIEHAKLRRLKRNVAVVLGNAGTADDADVLTRVSEDDEPLVREHAAWALARLGDRDAQEDILRRFRGRVQTKPLYRWGSDGQRSLGVHSSGPQSAELTPERPSSGREPTRHVARSTLSGPCRYSK